MSTITAYWPGTDIVKSQDNYFTLRPAELPAAAPAPVLGRPATGRRRCTSEDIKRDTAKRKLRRAAARQAKGSSFNVPIPTQAESDRSRAVRGRSI